VVDGRVVRKVGAVGLAGDYWCLIWQEVRG
jgi:hypothetical protein